MNARRPLPFVTVLAVLAGAATAQQEATTLPLLLQQSEAVVTATPGAHVDPSAERHAVRFRRGETLKGSVAADFELQEPAGRICGHALHGLQQDTAYLLFLEQRDGSWQVCGGERGAVVLTAGILAHVRALLQAGDGAARLPVLARGLDADDLRVRADAALSLAVLPGLAAAAAADRDRIATATHRELQAGSVHAAALVQACCRVDPARAADELLPTYLEGGRDELRPLLRAQLQRLPATAVGDALLLHWPRTDAARIQAAQLLAGMPAATSRPVLRAILQERPQPQAALATAQAMLQLGEPATALTGLVPAAVLDLAVRRAAAPPRRRP